jgi:hypothetical protein
LVCFEQANRFNERQSNPAVRVQHIPYDKFTGTAVPGYSPALHWALEVAYSLSMQEHTTPLAHHHHFMPRLRNKLTLKESKKP